MFNPFRGEKIERMPEKVNYIITTVVTMRVNPPGIAPYVSPVANGYSNTYVLITTYMSLYHRTSRTYMSLYL